MLASILPCRGRVAPEWARGGVASDLSAEARSA